MKNQWRVFVGFLLVLIVVLFAVLNNQQIPVNFGFIKIEGPLIVIILGSAIIGAIIGLITSTTTMWHQRKEIKRLKKEIEMYKNDVSQLASEEAEGIKRDYENQLAELQSKQEEPDESKPTETTTTESRVERFTKPRNKK